MCDEGEYEKLKGLVVTGLQKKFETGDEEINFITNKGNVRLWCDADCCSSSWFEHMELPEFPFTIQKAEEVDGKSPTDEEASHHECLDTYGLKFETDKGYVDIDMRNSSNGYYGGRFELDLSQLEN